MEEQPRRYFSFLLRLWQAESEDGTIWRCSLEDTLTRKIHQFATLEDLNYYLAEETELPIGREEAA
jgi:hypothetical protein